MSSVMFKLELLNFVEHAGIEDYDMMTKVTINSNMYFTVNGARKV